MNPDNRHKNTWKRISPWVALFIALMGIMCYFFQAVYVAHHVLPYMDEGTYLYKGYLFATGVYKPFQDFGFWTNKMPFSFLIPGWAELLFGPGIRTGRYFAIFLGIVSLVGLWLLGRRMTGNWGGTALVWLIASNSILIKYFSMGISQVIIFFLLIWIFYLITFPRSKIIPFVVGGLLTGVLLTTRENMVLILPLILGFVFWDKGWKSGLAFLVSFLLVFIGVHILYWPNILQLWSVWLQWITRWISNGEIAGTINPTGLGSPYWFPQMDAGARWSSFWEGSRQMIVPFIFLLVGLFFWLQKSQRLKIEKFHLALMLFFAFILLWVGHAWASLANNYCVYCYSPYLSFFSVIGLILGVMTIAEWTRMPTRWVDYLLIGLIILFVIGCIYFSLSGSLWMQIMYTEVPKVNSLQIENTTIQMWRLISNKYNIDYSVLLEKYQNIYGNIKIAAGIILCFFAAIIAGVWMYFHRNKHQNSSFGKIFLLSILIIISIFNSFINWNEIIVNNKDCGDIIAETEAAGAALQHYVKKDDLVYWEGGGSPLPLIYLKGIRIFPSLLNGGNSKRIGGDETQLQRIGFWNDALAARWKEEADILFVAGEEYEGTTYTWTNQQLGVTPPVYACLPESKIFILRNR